MIIKTLVINFRLAVEEVYVEHYLPKYAWSDYSFSILISKFDDKCANRTPAISENNNLLGTYNQGTMIGMLHLHGFEMYILINLFDSITGVKDRNRMLLNF